MAHLDVIVIRLTTSPLAPWWMTLADRPNRWTASGVWPPAGWLHIFGLVEGIGGRKPFPGWHVGALPGQDDARGK